jgi:alpha-glucosidase
VHAWTNLRQYQNHAYWKRELNLDYFYTAFHQASIDGSPVLSLRWFKYPQDKSTYSPVTDENAMSVLNYFPQDRFYDFATFAPIDGTGQHITLVNISFTKIPLYIRDGTVLHVQEFPFVVAPDTDGTATGVLYVDNSACITQKETTSAQLAYAEGRLTVSGSFELVVIAAKRLVFGRRAGPRDGLRPRVRAAVCERKVLQVQTEAQLDGFFEVTHS